jgi:hydroxymethylpyrimidine pyrophosphatase-like HAD family hydrolase
MTSQVLEMSLSTTVRNLDEATGRSTCDVHSTVIHIRAGQPILTANCSSALHAEFKEIVYKSFPNKKGLA